MAGIKTFRDLIIWQKSMTLVTEMYSVTADFPSSELYGLTNQMRRCAVSTPSNIAEGYRRKSSGDYKRFLQIAVASSFELQTQPEIAFNLKSLLHDVFKDLLAKTSELEVMTFSLIKKIN
ncbi:four helix bundle protein [Panacibacter sp. DH6]|uniref:Four helix bundle protein n=1 Tax=Panacibacter microcysteis TaxID=2793269 RepID=A0A931E6R8_9BACT|nr:four helix bundle protein [Panacibacter microcysteis]MBG9376491.1 four helix bundle protein [Panacibacter microcysteis]